MKNLKLVLMSLLVCSVVFMSSCGNSNQNSVAVTNSNVETQTVENETTATNNNV